MKTSQLIAIIVAIVTVGGAVAAATVYQWEIRAALRGEQYIGAVGFCGGDNARVCERLF